MNAAISGTAFVLAGGGSLGAIQVGMLQALTEAEVRPDFVVGSSVGAINAAHFAGAPDRAGVARLAAIWSRMRRADVFPLSLAGLWGALHDRSLVDPRRLRRLVAGNLEYARIERARLPLHIMATDTQGMGVRLAQGPVVDAVMASAAIPAVFPPVAIDGRLLMDGSIAANTPLQVAASLGARRIVVLPTGYACALKGPPSGLIARALHAVTLLIAWQLQHEISSMPATVDVHVAPTLCPLDVSPFDFSASDRLIARAARSTAEWIAGGGLERPAHANELAAHHH